MKKLLFIMLVLPLGANATMAEKAEITETRKQEYTFECSPNVLITTDNKYGKQIIELWDRNEVKIITEIVVSAKNRNDLSTAMNQISIEFNNSNSNVYAKTNIGKTSVSNTSHTINYYIYAPRDASLDIANTYGEININEAKNAKIKTQYGKFYCGKIETLQVDSQYDKYKISNCSNLRIAKCSYSEFIVEKLDNNVNANESDIKYSKIYIKSIASNFKEIAISSSYTNIELGFVSKIDADVKISLSYGGFQFDRSLELQDIDKTKKSSKISYHSPGKSTSVINITSRYGGVKLSKN